MKKLPTGKLKTFFSNRTNVILVVALVILLFGIIFGVQKIFGNNKPRILHEVDLPFDPDGPYALLEPRRDGNAINLNIFRVGSYDEFSYELVYQSTISEVQNADVEEGQGKVDRSAGSLDTFINLNKKSEFKQEILFGTCSQGYTSGGAHCVFDQGVENGTLTMRIRKGDTLYRMVTPWHLQKPDVALGVLTSADGHLTYKTDASREDLVKVGFSVINDLSGAPKLPAGKQFVGKVYALNVPTAQSLPKGDVIIELADKPAEGSKIARYDSSKNSWQLLESKIDGSKMTATSDGGGFFAILSDSSKK